MDTRDPHSGGRRKIRGLRRRPFTLDQIMKTPNRPAVYVLYSKRKKPKYVGSAGKPNQKGDQARGLRDRLLDHYYERGDHRTVPGKDELTGKAAFFDAELNDNVYKNRQRERELKRKLKPEFNVK